MPDIILDQNVEALPEVISAQSSSADTLRDRLRRPEGALVLVNKPYGETSFHVVSQIRRRISPIEGIKRVKVGHAGTLDPLATGLLIIATRGATKSITSLMGLDKVYELRLRLGVESPSFDLETPIRVIADPAELTQEAIREAVCNAVMHRNYQNSDCFIPRFDPSYQLQSAFVIQGNVNHSDIGWIEIHLSQRTGIVFQQRDNRKIR